MSATVKSVRVEVLPPFKVALAGQVWRPGEVAEVDEVTAGHWLRYGYVVLVGPPPEPEQPAKAKRPPRPPEPEQPDEPSPED
ncbi:hypothetical protein ACRU44_23550 [Mycobacterium colombiense]